MSSTQMLVRKSIVVGAPPEVAFRVFTEDINGWWPAKTHSVGEERVEEVVLEPRVGGRFFERLDDGTEHEWGRVTEFESPRRFACNWYASRGPDTAQLIEVTFEPEDGGTRVELRQTGWEILGDRAEELRASYDSEGGWDLVLARFAEAAECTEA
jgi:Activator of Hsp90 ATPase homolog 1-like protein